jgi:hypothetical protein
MDNMGPKPRLHLFGFLDETGLLHDPIDRVFGLGFLQFYLRAVLVEIAHMLVQEEIQELSILID